MRARIAIGAWAVVAALAIVPGCDRATDVVPDAEADHARGRATRAALHTGSIAATLAADLAARPRSTCRVDLPDGPVTVETRVTIALKGEVGQTRRYDQWRTWRRDEAGHVASSTRLVVPLPDGRRSDRTSELRRIGDERWSALDGRFAEAGRVPSFDERLADEARVLVDDVLSRVARDGDGLRAAHGDGLCQPRRALEPIDAEVTGTIAVDALHRGGTLEWVDADGAELRVVFDERIRAGAEPVAPPDEVWPVDADRGFAQTTALVEAGLAAGWLQAPDAPGQDVTLVNDEDLADE